MLEPFTAVLLSPNATACPAAAVTVALTTHRYQPLPAWVIEKDVIEYPVPPDLWETYVPEAKSNNAAVKLANDPLFVIINSILEKEFCFA